MALFKLEVNPCRNCGAQPGGSIFMGTESRVITITCRCGRSFRDSDTLTAVAVWNENNDPAEAPEKEEEND